VGEEREELSIRKEENETGEECLVVLGIDEEEAKTILTTYRGSSRYGEK